MNPIRVQATVIALLLFCIPLRAQSIPEKYHGGWVLDGHMVADKIKAPRIPHLVIFDSKGTMVRANMMGKEWEKEEAKSVTITPDGKMLVTTVDSTSIPLGSALITEDGKLHLIDLDGNHHLVYSRFDPITIK